MSSQSPAKLWAKVMAAVRRDPHKAGILTALFAILLVLQVRLQMSRGDGPSQANAAAEQPDNAQAPAHSDGSGVSTSINPQDSSAAMRQWLSEPSAPLARNIFTVDLDRFPQDGSNRPIQVAPMRNQGFWDELAKSMAFRADARKEQQILKENLQQQANQLRLQSTMMTTPPKAVIDGEMVGEGDVVASFRVLKIEPRRIEVEREGIKLEIQMK
jgi:hypothetical protein